MLNARQIDAFHALLRAARERRLILLDCTDVDSGAAVPALCLLDRRDGLLRTVPLAALLGPEALQTLAPPAEGGDDPLFLEEKT